jgi:hypothetical protein
LIALVLAVISLTHGYPGRQQDQGEHAAPMTVVAEWTFDHDERDPLVESADPPKETILPANTPGSAVDLADGIVLLVLTA